MLHEDNDMVRCYERINRIVNDFKTKSKTLNIRDNGYSISFMSVENTENSSRWESWADINIIKNIKNPIED